jgi:PAS domain S-box-containing protein
VAVVLACLLAGVTVVLGALVVLLGIERSKLAQAERRSRLGAEHARLHLSVLARAGDQMAGALDSYVEALTELVGVVVPSFADWFAVDLVDESGVVRRIAPPGARHPHPEGDELVRKVIEAGQDEVFSSVAPGTMHDGTIFVPGTASSAAPSDEVGSMLIVPVHVRGLALGALSFVTNPLRRGFRRSDLETAHGLADRVAVAIERVLLWKESRSAEASAVGRAEQLRRLMEASLAVNAPLAEPEILNVLATQAARVLDASHASVGTVPESREEEVIAAVSAPEPGAENLGELVPAACRLAARLNRPLRSTPSGIEGLAGPDGEMQDQFASPDAALDVAGDGGHWLAVPVPNPVDRSRRVIVVKRRSPSGYDAEDESVLVLLAQIASVALVNAHLYQEMRSSERRLRAVVESSPLAIAELAPGGEARWCNAAARPYFGGGPAGYAKLSPVDEDHERVWESVLERARNAVASVGVDLEVRGHDGERLSLSVSSAPLLGFGDEVAGVVVVAEDVTESRRVLEQMHNSQRLSSMARLAGGLAHDFNNLLTVILGSTELLASRVDVDDTWSEDVDSIRRAGQRAAALTAQLLAIGRDRARDPVPLAPDEVICSIRPMLERVLGESIELELDLDLSGERILADPADLERAILNLAMNARDAMAEGGKCSLRTASVPRGHDDEAAVYPKVVTISVADTGEGMDEQTARHCFDPFFSTKEEGRGTGLGLFAVQAIVNQAGGQVNVDTQRGRGTTFTLSFPLLEDEALLDDEASGGALGAVRAATWTP